MWNKQEWRRYERQLVLLSREGQKKLKRGSVLIAGAGGLGTAVSAYLAAAGVGRIQVIDQGSVTIHNLNRQILFTEMDLGKKKAAVIVRRLRNFNPHLDFASKSEDILSLNLKKVASSYQVLVDALDNFPARFTLNRVALSQSLPLIHGSVRGFYGQVTCVIPGRTACLRCFFPEGEKPSPLPVIGPACGVIGSLQALEVVKFLTGRGFLLENRLLFFDGLRAAFEEVEVKRRPNCPDCGDIPAKESQTG